MPWWGWVLIIVVLLVALSMVHSIRKVRSFSGSSDPIRYFARATHRMDEVEKVSSSLEGLMDLPGRNKHRVTNGAEKLRMLAKSQRDDTAPPELEDHKLGYYKIMDLEARKAEDFLRTGGANFPRLAEEAAELDYETKTQRNSAIRGYRELLVAVGMDELVCASCGERDIDAVARYCPKCGGDSLTLE